MTDQNKKIIVGDQDFDENNHQKSVNSQEELSKMASELKAMKEGKAQNSQPQQNYSNEQQQSAPAPKKNVYGAQKNHLEEEFEIPRETVELPSKGLFYHNNQSHVVIKYLTATEDDILYSPDLIKSGKVLDILLKEGVVASELPVEQLLISDRNAILLELRKTGLGDEFEYSEINCPSCKEPFTPVIDLNDFETKEQQVEPDENGEFDFPLPILKKNLKLRLLTGEDEKVLAKSSNTKPTKGKANFNRHVTNRFLRQIMEVDGVRDKTYIKKLVSAMPMKDSYALREYLRIIEPGLDFNLDVSCPNCEHVFDHDFIPNPIKLFYPDADV